MQTMGKHDSTPQEATSVDQLLSSIREAIESDTASKMAIPAPGLAKPIGAPHAPRLRGTADDNHGQPDSGPAAPSEATAVSEGDVKHGPGYVSSNPHRYRHSLESSPSYMSLRNRLASLKSRTRSGTSRSMASLLGGDVRQEEARARDQHPNPVAETPSGTESHNGLKAGIGDEQGYMDEFITGDISTGVVSYTPDYSDWSLENPLASAVAAEQVATEHDVAVPLATKARVTMDERVDAATVEEDEVETDLDETPETVTSSAASPDPQAGLPLEAMIRQVIEPELVVWIDTHLPEQVAAAMPSEEAFTAKIRPMIEQWLADNLSPIVEDAVRDEIARITGLKR